MKRIFLMATAALLVGWCNFSQAYAVANVEMAKPVTTSGNNVKVAALVEKARWGSGEAFLQLAQCYIDGVGVEKDFLAMMSMLKQAKEHGAIESEKDYVSKLPDSNVLKHCFNVFSMNSDEVKEHKDSLVALLINIDTPDARALYGMVNLECGDPFTGLDIMRKAADKGSNFASFVLAMFNVEGNMLPDKNQMEQLARKNPAMYKVLAKMYLDSNEGDENTNKKLAAQYYIEAEKHALLSKSEAAWLLSYFQNGGDVKLTDEDVKRLEAFCS